MRKLLLLAGLLLTLGACKKKDDGGTPAPTAPTRTELLTGKNWLLSAATLNPAISYQGLPVSDGYLALKLVQPCILDNTRRFDLPNAYTINEGASVCSPSEAGTGTWALSADGNTLTTVINGLTTAYTVVAVTATSLQISYPFTYNGANTTITATLTPK